MRVAITAFHAHALSGQKLTVWPGNAPVEYEMGVGAEENASFGRIAQRLLHRAACSAGLDAHRLAISFASSKGWPARFSDWAQQGAAWPFCDADAGEIVALTRAQGPVLCPVAACASGAHALALGANLIETGRADVVLAGANEPPQPEIILAAYRNMGALSKTGIMRPFDANRDGFMPASGGALFVLESETRARARGAEIHGFLTGYSLHCDAHHMTSMQTSGQGIARAIRGALEMAGNPKIDYINAHGTATLNDAIESRAIHAVFGDRVPISSTKALTGHLLGAAGAVEAALCLLAMKENFVPPTLNLYEPDTDFNLDYIPLHGRKMKIETTLSLNYGFGGHIGALVMKKY